jgi:isoleucyl-tRNA synthetase
MSGSTYRQLPADYAADTLERELLEQWRREGLFDRALEARVGATYVALEMRGPGGAQSRGTDHESVRRRLLVWTTTPWTLVSNVALAVHPDLEYVELRKRTGADWTIILATARAAAVLGDDYTDRWTVLARLTGNELAGQRYRRPLDWVPIDPSTGEHEIIIAAPFVSADDGTGIVHMAPAFGADDYAMGRRHNLAFLQPVNAPSRATATGGHAAAGVAVRKRFRSCRRDRFVCGAGRQSRTGGA